MTARVYSPLLIYLLLSLPLIASSQTRTPERDPDRFELSVSQEVREAIDAGVVLTFDCEFAIIKNWLFFTHEEDLKLHRFTLTRHKLSNRYLVLSADLPTPHQFRSITEATNYIAARGRLLLESYSDEQNTYSMRISLNKFELPTPMRLKAFIADSWNLSTDWILWVSES